MPNSLFDRCSAIAHTGFIDPKAGFVFYDSALFPEDDASCRTDCGYDHEWLDVTNDIDEEMLDPVYRVGSDPYDVDQYDDAGLAFHGNRDNRRGLYRMTTAVGTFEVPLGNSRAEEMFELTGVWIG